MMYDRQRFADLYGRLADDELARIALSNNLVPEAQEALTVELQKRGLNDLSEYKRLLEDAATSSFPESPSIDKTRENWIFVFAAWVLAGYLPPAVWLTPLDASMARRLWFVAALYILGSCYLGFKARREGSRKGFVLKFMLPLLILGVSTLVVWGGKLLGLW
jgi:hypothetical protein